MNKRYTEEQINKVCDLYKQGVPVKVIEKATGINESAISRIAIREGCEPRRPRRKGKYKTCLNCHKKINLTGVSYCPFCGNDLRPEKELLINDVERVIAYLAPLPSSDKDEARNILLKVKKYLKEN